MTATEPPPDAIIHVSGAHHRYGDIHALRGVDLSVPRGGFLALLGPNGAGKSTLVAILSTLLPLQQGAVRVAGHDVRRRPALVRRELGLVFQEPSLDERLTVLENLDFHGRIYGMRGRERAHRAREVLDLVELSEWANATVRVLSRGMKRRLEIARAIMHHPALLILDEPTVGLDVHSRHRFWTHLQDLRRETGVSLLLTTHQIEEAEQAGLVAIVDRGELLRLGEPATLRAEHGDAVITLRGAGRELIWALQLEYGERAEPSEDAVRLRVPDPQAALARLTRELPQVRSLSVQAPSLEDVFLDLTGRSLRDERPAARDATLARGAHPR